MQAVSQRDRWMWFTGLGLVSIVLGILAFIDAVSVSIASVALLGIVLVIAGVLQIAHALQSPAWHGRTISFVGAALYVLAGLLMIDEPASGAVLLTTLLAICLIIAGIARIVLALSHREMGGWQIMVLGGVVTLLIGVLIYASMPWSGLFLIGTFIAAELFVAGLAWVQLGLAMKNGRSA